MCIGFKGYWILKSSQSPSLLQGVKNPFLTGFENSGDHYSKVSMGCLRGNEKVYMRMSFKIFYIRCILRIYAA
jgi:hypothetical protein